MKLRRLTLLAAATVALASLPSPALAGKKNKNKDPNAQAIADVLAKYDTNGDGKISGDEATALRAAFDGADKDKLKRFDTNADGKLDDNEIAAIVADTPKKKKNKGKKAAEATTPAAPVVPTTPPPPPSSPATPSPKAAGQ